MSLTINIRHDSHDITHNLAPMAKVAGIHQILWGWEGIETARDLIRPLSAALVDLTNNPAKYTPFNAPKGWGVHANLVSFVAGVLYSAIRHPRARVQRCP